MPIAIAFIIALMSALHPLAPRTGAAPSFARAIAYVVSNDPPIEGVGRELGAALLVVYGWGESRFAYHAKRGDNDRSACAFQVMGGSEERNKQLEADPIACVRAAYAVLRASYKQCGDGSGYCGSCRGKAAKAIADARERQARDILAATKK